MTVAELPSWVDAGALKAASVGVVVGAIVLALISVMYVRSLAARLVALLMLGALAVGAAAYRADLDECLETCDCRLLGDPLPADECSAAAPID